MIGPTTTFSIVGSGAGAWRMNRCSKNPLPNWAMNPASRNPIVISFHSICQSPRKLCATSDHARRRGQPLAPRQLLAGRVMLMAGVGLARVLAGLLLELRADEQPQQHRHQHDHHDPADVLGERELPADQHPQHQPELPHEVGRGELERERRGGARALLKQRLARSRSRRRSTTRTRRRARSPSRSSERPSRSSAPRSARAEPTPARSRRSRTRAPAPTTPPTPSGTSPAGRARSHRARSRPTTLSDTPRG